MKNMPFVIWMLGFLLVKSATDYEQYLEGQVFSSEVNGLAAIIVVLIWGFVGYKLYEPTKSTPENKK